MCAVFLISPPHFSFLLILLEALTSGDLSIYECVLATGELSYARYCSTFLFGGALAAICCCAAFTCYWRTAVCAVLVYFMFFYRLALAVTFPCAACTCYRWTAVCAVLLHFFTTFQLTSSSPGDPMQDRFMSFQSILTKQQSVPVLSNSAGARN